MADVKNTEQICRDFLEKFVKEDDYDNHFTVTPVSTEGANYTSHLFITTLTKRGKKVNLFIKVAAVGEKLRAQNPLRMYETENYFYTKIVKIYKNLEEVNNVPAENRLRTPKLYACNTKIFEETLVLENLAAKGFTSHDRLQTVCWAYAAACITELAKYHALSIAYQEQNPEEFKMAAQTLTVDLGKNEQHQAFYDTLSKNALSVIKEENKDRLERYLKKHVLNRETFMELFRPKKRSVITHGDYRPSNLMHRQLKDGSLEVIPVDFQTAQIGSPITDLLYFIFTATDEEFRKGYYHQIIDHYYSKFSEALKRLGVNPDTTYSKDDFEFELKEKKPFGLCIAAFVLPIITVEAKNAPKVDKDIQLSSFSVQLNEDLFPQRINGIVDDYIRWGDLN